MLFLDNALATCGIRTSLREPLLTEVTSLEGARYTNSRPPMERVPWQDRLSSSTLPSSANNVGNEGCDGATFQSTLVSYHRSGQRSMLTALKKGQSQKNRVLYVVCARSAHTTYIPSFPLKRLFSAESMFHVKHTLCKHRCRGHQPPL